EWFRDLPIDDQVLLGVLYVEAQDLPTEWIEHIARRRGCDASVVVAQLDERAAAQANARKRIIDELDQRATRLCRLLERRTVVRAAMATRGEHPSSAEDVALSPER